jgi:2-polyprenyl-3-methyl-5-hydroxy-6-metoxy-1,4-benzoquinol methylase
MNTNIYENYTSTSALNNNSYQKELESATKYTEHFFTPYIQNKDSKILEIACGWGKYIYSLNKLEYRNVQGFDISKEQISFAKEKLKLDSVFIADAMDFIEKSEEKFDTILLIDILEHLEVDYCVALLKKIHEKLNTDGKILIQVPNGLSILNPIRYGDLTHLRSFTVKSLEQLSLLSGYKKIQFSALGAYPHGLKSTVRTLIWKFIFSPIIKIYMLVANGDSMGGIYTSNILAIIEK